MVSRRVTIGCSVVIVLVAIIVGLLISSLRRLSTEEAALQYNIHIHKLGSRVYEEGLHLGPPGFEFVVFPKVYKTIAFPDLKCLNADGLTIGLEVQFQYLVQTQKLKSIIEQFKDHDTFLTVLRHVAAGSIHDSCSEFNVTQFQTERARFQETIFNKLQDNFQSLGTSVSDVQISNIQRPAEYEQVIRDKEAAKQNIKIAQNERPRVVTEAKTKFKESETQAQITIQDAEAQSRIALTHAQANADAIMTAYQTEANTYKMIMTKQSLTVEGLLSYLATIAIQSAKKPVYVGMDSPAKTDYP